MSDLKSNPSSKGSNKASKEPTQRAQLSGRSQSDPATSNLPRSFSESYSSSGSTTDKVATGKRLSQQSRNPDTTGDEEENDEHKSGEDDKPTATKRHSHHSHTNVHTQCGRHSDEWLFGPITAAVKSVFKK